MRWLGKSRRLSKREPGLRLRRRSLLQVEIKVGGLQPFERLDGCGWEGFSWVQSVWRCRLLHACLGARCRVCVHAYCKSVSQACMHMCALTDTGRELQGEMDPFGLQTCLLCRRNSMCSRLKLSSLPQRQLTTERILPFTLLASGRSPRLPWQVPAAFDAVSERNHAMALLCRLVDMTGFWALQPKHLSTALCISHPCLCFKP